jgi:1-deoxyxylulose-5-phosphate synthase
MQTSDAYHDEAIMGVEWEKEINRRVEELSIKRGVSMAQIALGRQNVRVHLLRMNLTIILAWVLHQDNVCAPIVGISKLERFEDVLRALDVKLSDEELKYLEEPYQP